MTLKCLRTVSSGQGLGCGLVTANGSKPTEAIKLRVDSAIVANVITPIENISFSKRTPIIPTQWRLIVCLGWRFHHRLIFIIGLEK